MFKVKKVISGFLVLVLTLGLAPTNAMAADSKEDISKEDIACFANPDTGDNMTIEVVAPTTSSISAKGLSADATITRIERNGEFDGFIYVDFKNDIMVREYADGSIETDILSDIVTITDAGAEETLPQTGSELPSIDYSPTSTYAPDYVWDEPLGLDANGNQLPLTGAPTVDEGYKAMGSRAGDLSPTTVGYLQRKDVGQVGTLAAHNFTFAIGTTIEAAISIIRSFFSASKIEIAVTTITSLIAVVYAWKDAISVTFTLYEYQWAYRVRIGSDYSPYKYDFYRIISYWSSYDESTGAQLFEQADSRYMYGYLQDNMSMINAGINKFLGLA